MSTGFRFHISISLPLVLCMILLSGCDYVYRLLHKEGAEEKKIVGEIIPLEKNPNIEEVQELLDIYGYDPGPVDGVLGRRTRDAIERFQKDNEINPSRFVDEATWQKLRLFRDLGFVEDGELNIVLLQRTLKNAGFDPGVPDGKYGPRTKEAVLKFQRSHDLKADAKVGFKTLTALQKYLPPEN